MMEAAQKSYEEMVDLFARGTTPICIKLTPKRLCNL